MAEGHPAKMSTKERKDFLLTGNVGAAQILRGSSCKKQQRGPALPDRQCLEQSESVGIIQAIDCSKGSLAGCIASLG